MYIDNQLKDIHTRQELERTILGEFIRIWEKNKLQLLSDEEAAVIVKHE